MGRTHCFLFAGGEKRVSEGVELEMLKLHPYGCVGSKGGRLWL